MQQHAVDQANLTIELTQFTKKTEDKFKIMFKSILIMSLVLVQTKFPRELVDVNFLVHIIEVHQFFLFLMEVDLWRGLKIGNTICFMKNYSV